MLRQRCKVQLKLDPRSQPLVILWLYELRELLGLRVQTIGEVGQMLKSEGRKTGKPGGPAVLSQVVQGSKSGAAAFLCC